MLALLLNIINTMQCLLLFTNLAAYVNSLDITNKASVFTILKL